MPDLHARLLAEIERREGRHGGNPVLYLTWEREVLAYLAALRTVVGLHAHPPGARTSPDDGRDRDGCITCTPGIAWPCPTLRAVATALDVST